ncbi:MAG: hypothetical protein QG623_684 [Patescibacteria group bacterium]|nr:hypothetical protein [Patescibacteria group bacterium]
MQWQKNQDTHIVRWLRRRTLVFNAKQAIGSRIWAKSFILDSDGNVHDIYEDGKLSCSTFISGILRMNNLWDDQTVANTSSLIQKLPQNGWELIDEPRIGCLIIYEDNKLHRAWATKHIGILVDDDLVVSNSSNDEPYVIRSHPINYMKMAHGDWRKIEGYWWHKDFEDDDLFHMKEDVFTRTETPVHKFEKNT